MPKTFLTAIFLICALAATLESILTLPDIYYNVSQVPDFWDHPEKELSESAEFLRSHFKKGETVLILSTSSGIYHIETETVSPLNAPSLNELIFRKDWDEIAHWLEHPHPGVSVVADPSVIALFPILKKYAIRKVSPNQKLYIVDGPFLQ
jgi:hypothetical protein